MLRFSLYHFLLCFMAAGFLLTSCNNDDNEDNNSGGDSDSGSSLPDHYHFNDANYAGVEDTLNALSTLVGIVENPDTYNNHKDNGMTNVFNNNLAPSVIASHADVDARDDFRNYFDTITTQSVEDTVINGTYFKANGVEVAQMIDKGLYGACFWYRASSILNNLENYSNSNPGENYTEREQQFDRAFGYMGIPENFKTNTTGKFWGGYLVGRSPAFEEDDFKTELFNAFIKCRQAISNQNETTWKNSRNKILKMWEELIAANTIHYINSTLSDMEAINNGEDATGDKWHHWSEGRAFLNCLKYYDGNKIGSNWSSASSDFGMTPKEPTRNDLENARQTISDAYGFTQTETANF